MRVAGQAGEEQEVRVGQRLGRALEAVADLEILEEVLAAAHQPLQNSSRTAGVAAANRRGRSAAEPGRPVEYQARCFLSCTSARRSGRCASISAQWRAMI